MENNALGERQFDNMLNMPIPQLVLKMSIPTVITMMVTVIYNTADTYFVSQINKSASAAVGAVYAIMSVIQAVGFGLGMGAGSLISLMLGMKKNRRADEYASSAFFTAFIMGAFVGYTGLMLLQPMLKVLGCSDTMMPYAKDYARYILMVAPISCSMFVLNCTLRAEGESNLAMWGIGTGGLLNMVLDPILIFSFNLGTGGAAIATALSQIVSFSILISMFLRKKTIVRINYKNVSSRLRTYGQIVSTGFPTICRQSLGSLAAALLNIQAVVYGDAAVSAITIANKVYVLVRNIILGLGQGFQPVAGYNYGAGNKKRTWQAFTFTSVLGTCVCVFCAALVAMYAKPIMNWFSKDPDVVRLGVTTLYFGCMVLPVLGFTTFVNQVYQCLGFKKTATFLASLRQGIFFVPVIMISPLYIGLTGVQATQPVSDFLTFLVSVPAIIIFYRKYIGKESVKA